MQSVQAATTAALPACTYYNGAGNDGIAATLTANSNGAFPTIDGITIPVNPNGTSLPTEGTVLVRSQATQTQNGTYFLFQQGDASHPWILERMDQLPDYQENVPLGVRQGNTYAGTVWVLGNYPAAIGTDNLVFELAGVGSPAAAPTPTRQYLKTGSSSTYTTPANCRAILVKMLGAGGGGGATATNNGSAGGDTIFNSVHAAGGSGGTAAGTGAATGGAGGTGGTGSANLRIAGTAGGGTVGSTAAGGIGGGSFMGGSGTHGTKVSAGVAGTANTGTGGSGGGASGSNNGSSGGGGGEYVELYISSPSATYTYTVGTGGNGGAAGTLAGGAGGSGLIIVEEYY